MSPPWEKSVNFVTGLNRHLMTVFFVIGTLAAARLHSLPPRMLFT